MLMSKIKILIHLSFFLLMLYALVQHELIIYGISQGKGQLNIIVNSKPIDDVLKDESFPDSLKQKLLLIEDIKQFATDSIGILPSNNYTTVYNQQNKSILWVVSACEPYSFTAKEWSFPVLGSVPYKGFFNEQKANTTLYELKTKGYDVDMYSPSGWSTLGWMNDPILSNMLYRSEGQLANLIIHELTHGTLYVKNNVTFNENLANFIGDKGAEWFLRNKFGIQSSQYLNYEKTKHDEAIFKEYILGCKEQLQNLYNLLATEKNDSVKKLQKINLLKKCVRGVNDLPLYKKQLYFKSALQIFKEKNAYFMAFSRYDSQQEMFEKDYKTHYDSNLKEYLSAMKLKYPSL